MQVTKANLYSLGLLLYPFSVLFCPPINFGLFYARVDETLILLFMPMLIADLKVGNNRTYNSLRYKLLKPYGILFLVFCWGILWANGFDNLNGSYVRQILRPMYLIIVALTVKKLLSITNLDKTRLLIALLISICLAGLLGYYAMYDSRVSMKLIRMYNPDIEYNKYFEYTFDMSVRAISVFHGYDQASVTYAFGCILAIVLTMTMKKDLKYRLGSVASIPILLVSIISSARIGFISLLGGGIVLYLWPYKKRLTSKILVMIILLCFFVLLPHIGALFPKNTTFYRFSDALEIFNFGEKNSLMERSKGLFGVMESQVLDTIYPDGVNMVFGFGDNTRFISDVAYISIFVKYGLVGLFAVFYIYFRWISSSLTMIRIGMWNNIPLERRAVSFMLPSITVLFFIAAMKGPLYFITIKTGELVSIIIGLALFECQANLGSRERKEDFLFRSRFS